MDSDNNPKDTPISVLHILDKKNGDYIFLDSAAFEAAGCITDPQCKDIAGRLMPDIPYEDVKKRVIRGGGDKTGGAHGYGEKIGNEENADCVPE